MINGSSPPSPHLSHFIVSINFFYLHLVDLCLNCLRVVEFSNTTEVSRAEVNRARGRTLTLLNKPRIFRV